MTKSSRLSHQGMKSFSVSVCERVLMRAVPIVAMMTDEDKMSTHYTDQVSAEDQGNTLVTPDTSEALGALRPPVSQVERDEDMRVEA